MFAAAEDVIRMLRELFYLRTLFKTILSKQLKRWQMKQSFCTTVIIYWVLGLQVNLIFTQIQDEELKQLHLPPAFILIFIDE